jgi:hypothetical protein
MARRTGWLDYGKSGIPDKVADSGAGAVLAGFAARVPREGGRDRGFREVIELSGKVLKTCVI